MQEVELNVVTREAGLKSTTHKLRGRGMVPANIYGPGLKNSFCAFSEMELRRVFNNDFSANFILSLNSETLTLKGKKVVLKSVERDPVSWKLVHADLYEVAMDRALTVELPIRYTGTAVGVKDGGGIFQIIRRSVKVRALPAEIPESLEVDVSHLPLGGSLHLSDIEFDSRWKVLDSLEFTIASVVEPEKEEVVAPVVVTAPGAEGAEASAAEGAAAASAGGEKAAADAGKTKAAESAKKAEPAKK